MNNDKETAKVLNGFFKNIIKTLNTLQKIIVAQIMHGTIILTGITCRKISCYMRQFVDDYLVKML